MEVPSTGALCNCIGGVGALNCEVPSCICNKSTPIPNKLCELHQCNIGHLNCDCLPPPAFFIFPSNQEERARWISLINREDLLINGSWLNTKDRHHICWRHFPDGKPTNANPDPVQNLINGSPSHKADSDQEDMLDMSTESQKDDIVNSSSDFERDNSLNLSSDSVKNDKLNMTTEFEKNNTLNRPVEKENTPNASPDSERDNANVSGSEKYNTQNTSADSEKNNTMNTCADLEKDSTLNTSADSEKDNTLNTSADLAKNKTLNTSADSEMDKTQNTSADSEMDNTLNTSADSEMDKTQNTSADSEKDNTLNTSADLAKNKTLNTSADPEKDNTLNTSADSEKDKTLNTSADLAKNKTQNMSADMEKDKTLSKCADPKKDNTQNTSADLEKDNTLNMSADPEKDNTLNTSADLEKDNMSKAFLGKASPLNSTTSPSETEKRQRKARNSKSKPVKVSSCEADSSDSDSSSDSDNRVYCKCGKPNTEKMIGCDGKNCEFEWFHFKCIGIQSRRQVPRGKWYCDDCSKEVKDAQKKAMDLKLKLKQICKDIMTKKTTLQSASDTHGVSKAEITKQLYSEPILTTQEEERLVGLALSMAKQGRGVLVKRSILNNVKVLLDVEEKMGIKRLHPFKKNLPEDEWWYAFCKRHPQIKKMNLHKLPKMTLLSKMKMLKQKANSAPLRKKEKENTKSAPLVSKQSHTPVNSRLKRAISPQTTSRDHDKEDQKNDIKKLKCSPDATHEKLMDVDNFEPNALNCLEAVLTKKQKHLFQYRFKNGIEHDDDVVYSAWRALKLLHYGTREAKQDDTKNPPVPQSEGDIPPWSPWRKGPFYVPDKCSKSSVCLLIDEPGRKREKKMMSRIASMGVKRRGHYLEPWRFGVCNRKVFKPRKTEVKKRRSRKRRVTRRFEGYVL